MTPLAIFAACLLCAPSTSEAPASPAQAPALPAAPAVTHTVFADTPPEVIAEGYRFVEGPTWVAGKEGRPGYLIFCEYPSSTVYRLTPGSKPEPLVKESEGALGSAVDAQGRLYLAQAGARRIARLDPKPDGTYGPPVELASAWDGQPLNDTNDLTVAPDGTVYFSDPTFFNRGQFKLKHKGVYRIAPDGKLTLECATMSLPNGVALSPDGKTLYVNEFGEGKVMAFAVKPDGALAGPTLFADLKVLAKGARGGADGLKVRPDGVVITTGPGGLLALSPKGELLDTVKISGLSNVAIGGDQGRDLFITAGGKVLRLSMKP